MAGRGFAPKQQGRRNHHTPQRGDWVDLRPEFPRVLPDLPSGEWSDRTEHAWEAWALDPATSMYGPAEVQLTVDLAYVYESWVTEGTAALASELRQRQDGLGLSPKGKQDRRWRVSEAEVIEVKSSAAQGRRLRAVDPAS